MKTYCITTINVRKTQQNGNILEVGPQGQLKQIKSKGKTVYTNY